MASKIKKKRKQRVEVKPEGNLGQNSMTVYSTCNKGEDICSNMYIRAKK